MLKWKRIRMILVTKLMVAGTLFLQRKRAGLSLRGAALKAGISPVSLRDIEFGIKNPSCVLISRLLQIYQSNVDVQLLFCLTPNHPFMFIRLFMRAHFQTIMGKRRFSQVGL